MMKLMLPMFCAIALMGMSPAPQAAEQRPNIIFFITDDQFKEMMNWMPEGKGKNFTPATDALTQEATVLLKQYVTSPVCTPSRFASITGTYPSRSTSVPFIKTMQRNGGQSKVEWNTFVEHDTRTVAHDLQQAGYYTGFVGKNHTVEVPGWKLPPWDGNVDDPEVKALLDRNLKKQLEAFKNAGFEYGASLYYNNPSHNGLKALASHNLDWIAQGAENFIGQAAKDDRPFFLWVATTIPHGPQEAARSWKADRRVTSDGMLAEPLNLLSTPDQLTSRLKAAGKAKGWQRENILWLDDLVGHLVGELKSTGQYDNTVIIYFNDHGQRSKGTVYQGGVHSEAFVWKKGGFPAGRTSDVPVSNIDFAPTILELAGVSPDQAQSKFDGKSMLPVLNGETDQLHESLFFELGYVRGVKKGKWKYVALRYPEWVQNMTRAEREKALKEFNKDQVKRGRPVYTEDPMSDFSHVLAIPGGGDAEHMSMGKYPGFYDEDQLYNLEEDPDEQVNLASNPEYASQLKEMKQEMQKHLNRVPGTFGDLKQEGEL